MSQELELKLTQSHMTQKKILRGEVGARVLRVRSVSREEAWASTGVQGAWVSMCGCEADKGMLKKVHGAFGGHLVSFYPHDDPMTRGWRMSPNVQLGPACARVPGGLHRAPQVPGIYWQLKILAQLAKSSDPNSEGGPRNGDERSPREINHDEPVVQMRVHTKLARAPSPPPPAAAGI